jgi:SAM-dependent methyltransferase
MSDTHPTEQMEHPAQRHVRAVVVDTFKVIFQPGPTYEKTRAQLVRQGLPVYETPHFLFARVPASPFILLVHHFSAQEIDNSLGEYLVQELAPHELLPGEEAFSSALIGVVTSILPDDPVAAWGFFSLNTLQRLAAKLDMSSPATNEPDLLLPFARIYRRLSELLIGSSLLDVGCACAFWPVLVAQRYAEQFKRIVGVDNRTDALALSEQLAALVQSDTTKFSLADVLAPEFTALGRFDTVTAIHLLEHLSETLLPDALMHLLQVTRHRLLIAVPYEDQPTLAYGHAQVFTREKLEEWGRWCVERLNGKGKMHCEDLEGGLLLIERTTA